MNAGVDEAHDIVIVLGEAEQLERIGRRDACRGGVRCRNQQRASASMYMPSARWLDRGYALAYPLISSCARRASHLEGKSRRQLVTGRYVKLRESCR